MMPTFRFVRLSSVQNLTNIKKCKSMFYYLGRVQIRSSTIMAENQTEFTLLPKVINGGVAGIIGVTCTFPLDLVKTRLQKQTVGVDGKKMYNSIVDAFRKILASEGFLGMYRGSGVLILLVTPENAVRMSANDFFRFHLKDPNGQLGLFRQALSGALTGLAHSTVTTPMELLKIQLQDAGRVAAMEAKVNSSTGKSALPKISATKIAMNLVKQGGILGLYKGNIATISRDVPFCTMYFPLFAQLDALGPRKTDGSGDAKFYWSFMCGLMSGSFAAFVMTPADVMKTRIQTVTKSAKGDKTYPNIFAAAQDIYKTEGIKAFFKGGACRVIAIAPLYAIVQGIYFLGVAEKVLGIKKDIKSV